MAEGTTTDTTATTTDATTTTGGAATTDAGKTTDTGKSATGAVDTGKTDAGADAGKQADADKGKTTDAGKAAVVEPVDYAKAISEVQMPEGMTLDSVAAKAGAELFAKHGISAEAAKEMVAMYAAQQKAGAEGNAKAFATQVDTWKAEAEKSTTAEERGTAKEAALKIFGKDEVGLLEHFGVTNRAGFIKALAKVGKAIKDDSFVPGNAGGDGARDARAMFPNSNMNP